MLTEYLIPTQASGPLYIQTGPDGNIWFTENTTNKIGKLNLQSSSHCELYPIAIHHSLLTNVTPEQAFQGILASYKRSNFAWLSWTGAHSTTAMLNSLTPPDDSSSYRNPKDLFDTKVFAGDWVRGRVDLPNSDTLRTALSNLASKTIAIPLWDQYAGSGSHVRFRVISFVQIQLTDSALRHHDRVSFIYKGAATRTAMQ